MKPRALKNVLIQDNLLDINQRVHHFGNYNFSNVITALRQDLPAIIRSAHPFWFEFWKENDSVGMGFSGRIIESDQGSLRKLCSELGFAYFSQNQEDRFSPLDIRGIKRQEIVIVDSVLEYLSSRSDGLDRIQLHINDRDPMYTVGPTEAGGTGFLLSFHPTKTGLMWKGSTARKYGELLFK